MRKICFKCKKEKLLSDFYRHSEMKDGRLNKCKECTKSDTKSNRRNKIEHYTAYEKKRAKLPHRKDLVKKYNAEHKEEIALYKKEYSRKNMGKCVEATRKWRKNNPDKYKAHCILNNSLSSGGIVKSETCFNCSCTSKLQAHHEDYSKPLDVVWLCDPCHKKIHRKRGLQ